MRTRVLFVSEAVTLAQVVRLVTLARGLDPARYEIHVASAAFAELVFAGTTFRRWPITSLAPEVVEGKVARGERIYDEDVLARYVDEETKLFAEVAPDVVVGDLRLSLAISAPRAGVPYVSLINAYWSPHAARARLPLPDHPIVARLGVALAGVFFPLAMPFVMRSFARPVNALRKRHGLPAIGSLREVLTFGDRTIFPDVPELVPTRGLPPHQRYIGPVLWAPDVAPPSWWTRLDPARPTVYVTLGSSGNLTALPAVLEATRRLGYQVLLATAGRTDVRDPGDHVFTAPFLRGDEAARRAHVVVSNGGSTTGYQALAAGKPVLGIPWNLDQYLATTAIEAAGAGRHVRAGQASVDAVAASLRTLVEEASFTRAAERLARVFSEYDAPSALAGIVDELVGGEHARGGPPAA